MIPVEKILDAIHEQAKQGSCKACKWCTRLPEPDQGRRWGEPGKIVTLTHYCQLQSNVNPIHFAQEDLDSMAYPGRCVEGIWHDAEAEGLREDFDECFAYYPGYDGTLVGDPIRHIEAQKHAGFMRYLGEAMSIYNAIRGNKLAYLTAKLNEAKESMPAVPAM